MRQSTLQTLLLAILAAATTALAVQSLGWGGSIISRSQSEFVENWEALADSSTVVMEGDGSITVIEFIDFQCPFCAHAQSTIEALDEKYPGRLTLLLRHFPLPRHAHAMSAAEAAECAGEQGTFSDFHDLLFEKQDSLGLIPWDTMAATAGVADLRAFRECLDAGRYRARIEHDLSLAKQLGFTGTPGFIVNGKRLKGAHPLAEFEALVN